MKLQHLKNFKYKYLFGDKIPKGDGAFSKHIQVDVFLPIPFAMEHGVRLWTQFWHKKHCTLTKKRKKAYEMNKHIQDTWVVKLPWAICVMGSNGKVVQVCCKLCSLIEGNYKLLVANLDSLWKHASCCKILVAM
jgi:hypothetical protein